MKASDLVAIRVDGHDVEFHIPNADGDYATICGLDFQDICQEADAHSSKITCPNCFAIWETIVKLRIRRHNFNIP